MGTPVPCTLTLPPEGKDKVVCRRGFGLLLSRLTRGLSVEGFELDAQVSHQGEERQHHTQVMPEQLTQAFRRARNASGYYAGESNPSTLHEIRSLGADRYRDQGWPEEWIQALLGHEDAETTRLYLRRTRTSLAGRKMRANSPGKCAINTPLTSSSFATVFLETKKTRVSH